MTLEKRSKAQRHYDTRRLGTAKVLLVSWCLSVLVSGCYKSLPSVTELTEAHKKFEQLLPKDYSINAAVEHFSNTLYVYVPVDFDILKTKAASPDPFAKPKAGQKRQVNFADTTFQDGQLSIQYDITPINTYPKELGYASAYTDQFSALHNNVLSALSRSYGDLKEDQKPMDFIVMMIVDVRNGIGIKNIFYFKDLQRVMSATLPQDEYMLRYMTEMIGDEKFINNTNGGGLDFKEITWPEFIAKQITYRINFKYSRSDFPPVESDTKEILSIVNDTVSAYDFTDFDKVRLENLADGTAMLFDKKQLETFKNSK